MFDRYYNFDTIWVLGILDIVIDLVYWHHARTYIETKPWFLPTQHLEGNACEL